MYILVSVNNYQAFEIIILLIHILIILANDYKLLTTEAYDDIISAELSCDKYLRSLVLKHMMHGPSGHLNPTNSCMRKKGYCKFKYPKKELILILFIKTKYGRSRRSTRKVFG